MIGHLLDWLSFLAGDKPPPERPPARITYYTGARDSRSTEKESA